MNRYEIEQKFRLKSSLPVRRLLRRLGAIKLGAGFQDNEYYDAHGKLKAKRMILRLRRTGKTALLTLKGPRLRGVFTKRPEYESPVDFRQTQVILRAMGFSVRRQYRKYREEYRFGGALVVLDRLPTKQWFLEIEGKPEQISRIAKQLSLRSSDREERSYLAILFPQDRIKDHVR